MKTDKVKDYLEQAIARVKAEDCHLLMIDVSERCITTRLAMYLREHFDNYNYAVDVEYNRHGEDKKQLHDLVQRVLPDVIVHKRGHDNSNLLIIEMKKSAANKDDIEIAKRRIRAFRDEFGYKFGAMVVCETKEHPAIYVKDWYE